VWGEERGVWALRGTAAGFLGFMPPRTTRLISIPKKRWLKEKNPKLQFESYKKKRNL
jgi:hypothetical protein